MCLKLYFFIFTIFVPVFFDGLVAQQCISMPGSPFDACTVAGYNTTFAMPYELSEKAKKLVSSGISILLSEFVNNNNCSVALMGETILCSVYAPSCTEENPNPNLPCRRVCSEFLKKCHAHIDPFWLEYYVGYCTLLPNKTASSGQCYEPEGFEEHYNASTTGLLEDKCNRLIFPWCQGIGYEHTIMKESTQIATYVSLYEKNFTNDSTRDAISKKGSEISYWNEILANNSKCASDIKKMLCADFFPPCFPDEGLSLYTVCKPICDKITRKCPNTKRIKSFEAYFHFCETKALGESSHGFCRYTKWPDPMGWLNLYKDRRPKVSPKPSSNGLSTPVIVAIVIIPLISISISVLAVVLWKQRKLPWFNRLFKRADDTRGFSKDVE